MVHENDTVSDLDLGLREAFGTHATDPNGRIGVLDALEQRLGLSTRVHLRDEDAEAPLVRPDSPEAPADPPRYQILGEIARGGVGVVLTGRDGDLGRDVAMKVLQRRHRDNPAMVRRFVEEAQIAGQLQHPGVLPVYELGLDAERRPFFTMKLVKGRTLASLFEERETPGDDRPRFVGIFEQVCQTMAYAHSRGVVHRDLKPSNVMVGQFGEVQVVDWGLAKVLARGDDDEATPAPDTTVVSTVRSETTEHHSQAGSVMGTPAYMAPEQARGDVHQVDERTDVFALGGMLCEILTGKPPFTAKRSERDDDTLGKTLERLDTCDAAQDLIALARSCLAPERSERPRSAMRVAEAVGRHVASVEERARELELSAAEARASAAQERRARRLTVALVATIFLAILLGLMGLSLIRWQQEKREFVASTQLNDALDDANVQLGQAMGSPLGDPTPWNALRAAGERVATVLDGGSVDVASTERAMAFLEELARTDRDRRLVELIEDAVITGATHFDRESWTTMADRLIAAFGEFGVDLTQPPAPDTAALIRASDSAVHLTEGLELWIGSEGQLMAFGAMRYTPDELRAWVPVVLDADPDPFRQEQRRIYYALIDEFLEHGGVPAEVAPQYLARLQALTNTVDFETATPRSLSWLAVCFATCGAPNMAIGLYERAIFEDPDDFMLNFDYAYLLVPMERWEEAIRCYTACLAIRDDVAGVWRSLGVAYGKIGRVDQSLRALERSITLQPDHAPTLVDLGKTYRMMGDEDAAEAAFQRAVELQPDLEPQIGNDQ